MELSIYLAKILGIVYVVLGVALLFNCGVYQKMYKEVLKSSSFTLFSGLLGLIIGLIIVLAHNYWVASWEVIITIFGWAAFIKGLYLLLFPSTISIFDSWFKGKLIIKLAGVGSLILGVVLAYFGFIA